MSQQMTSSRPYLLRAIYDWILDNEMTPYLLVNDNHPEVHVPREYVEDGKIVLNISPSAVDSLYLGNEEITFSARFSGEAMQVYVPLQSATALYAKENGQGMIFSVADDEPVETLDEDDDSDPPSGPRKPDLRVVK